MTKIRQAQTADIPAIVQLNHALFQEDAGQRDATVNLNWAVAHGQEHFTRLVTGDNSLCFVAEAQQQIVGYLAGYVSDLSDYRLMKTAELESMFIQQSYRGQGVGTALASFFTQWAQANGAEVVTVTAYVMNETAVHFYHSLGFAPKQMTLTLNLKVS